MNVFIIGATNALDAQDKLMKILPILFFIIYLQILTPLFSCIECLKELEKNIQSDLVKVNIPSQEWMEETIKPSNTLDVVIIGGGMAGMTAALALIKEGITHIKIFDENKPSQEGPWAKYARMNILRSEKTFMGPALGIPSLTFWSWHEALYGKESWEQMKSIPTKMWNDYLCWFRNVLHLEIENNTTLKKLIPHSDSIELLFEKEERIFSIFARKVILATGREGSGGPQLPVYIKDISKTYYAHSTEVINPGFFKNKKIAVIGGGASAFDIAGTALENDAQDITILIRRSNLPKVHKLSQFSYSGIKHGFYFLEDELRFNCFMEVFKRGVPPPKEAIERIKDYQNFSVHYDTEIKSIEESENGLILHTSQSDFSVDFLILATGFTVNLSKRPELALIEHSILLWKDKLPEHILSKMPKLGFFPYLGPHFEFIEAEPGSASYLKNIYCFNYGALLSHGLLSNDIPGISAGAARLAQGITTAFFLENCELYMNKYHNYNTPLFEDNILNNPPP